MKGRLYLIPVPLGGDDYLQVIPGKVIAITKQLRHFIDEDTRSARRYLRLIDREFPINDSIFFELNEHTPDNDVEQFLDPLMKGFDTGLMSEAGLPAIADPGSRIVALAHEKRIIVTPLSGPSSIVLSLIASGMNGQNFTFNGYLPVKPSEREAKLKELERNASKGVAQIFMETPYRNRKMIDSILSVCNGNTRLCIAADITLPSESIRTLKISEWKKNQPDLEDRLVVYVLQ